LPGFWPCSRPGDGSGGAGRRGALAQSGEAALLLGRDRRVARVAQQEDLERGRLGPGLQAGQRGAEVPEDRLRLLVVDGNDDRGPGQERGLGVRPRQGRGDVPGGVAGEEEDRQPDQGVAEADRGPGQRAGEQEEQHQVDRPETVAGEDAGGVGGHGQRRRPDQAGEQDAPPAPLGLGAAGGDPAMFLRRPGQGRRGGWHEAVRLVSIRPAGRSRSAVPVPGRLCVPPRPCASTVRANRHVCLPRKPGWQRSTGALT
jgi:hypothetical protein